MGVGPIGISSGVVNQELDPIAPSTFAEFKRWGCQALEISCHNEERLWRLELEPADVAGFAYLSLHLPNMLLTKDHRQVIERVKALHAKLQFNAVVLHPDCVGESGLFSQTDVPLAIENLDGVRSHWSRAKHLRQFVDCFVLDVNHAYEVDPTMQLVDELLQDFGDRLAHVHLSGYSRRYRHVPIYKEDQKAILDSVPQAPVIIESMGTCEEIKREVEHIKQYYGTTASH